ncbi:MAG: hypothetical protein LBH04_03255 [Tannerellaceae bacterium]|jgi:hypothetical protein|nr:hypothetical protein [Tannerellaceae bacterium]
MEDIYKYMANPLMLSRDTLPRLEKMVAEYPYFATARMLYLKNLALLNDSRFTKELQRTSIYVSDRKMLLMLIEEVRLIVEADKARPKQEQEDSFATIDKFLESHNNQLGDIYSDPAILFSPSVSTDYLTWLDKGQPVEIDENAPKLKHHAEISRFEQEIEAKALAGKMLIEWDSNPDAEPPQRMGEYAPTDDSYFTETLAKVYIRQRKYAKALETIKNISLKYPQKNIYFADQIRFLEKLIINEKNKN